MTASSPRRAPRAGVPTRCVPSTGRLAAVLRPAVLLPAAVLLGLPLVASAGVQEEAEEVAAPPADPVFVIRAERLHAGPGQTLEGQSILVAHGRVAAVAPDLEVPEGAVELEAPVVCAGFIDATAMLGVDGQSLGDGGASAATRTVDAFDPYSELHRREDALRGGVTAFRLQVGVQARVGGLGAFVRNGLGEDVECLVLTDEAGVGAAVRGEDGFQRLDEVDRLVSELEKGRRYREAWAKYREELAEWEKQIAEKLEELEKDFKKAKKKREEAIEEAEEEGEEFEEERYKEDRKPRRPNVDRDSEVLARVAAGALPLVVRVDRAADVRALLRATRDFPRLRLVFVGADDAYLLADELAARGVAVIVEPRPGAATTRHDANALELAAALHAAGVEVLIGSGGGSATRDLALLAGLAVGHGLPAEAALHAITAGPARALDVDGRVGRIAPGMDADLLLLSGDPLASTTQVLEVLVGGRLALED